MTPERQTLGQRIAVAHRTASMVVLAVLASVVVYAVIGMLLGRSLNMEGGQPAQARIPFYVAAFFSALASIGIRRTQLRPVRLQAVANAKGADGLIKHFVTMTLVSASLGELVAVLGLVLCLLGNQRDLMWLLIALAVVALSYPRREVWERTITHLAQQSPAG